VKNVDAFLSVHGAAWEMVAGEYGQRLRLRSVAPELPSGQPVSWNCVRFVTEPVTAAPYVYLTDVDIITLDSDIADRHIDNMHRFGSPYSNVVRPGTTRLTGLHFCERRTHYPIPDLADLPLHKMNDEMALYEIVRRKGIKIYDDPRGWRPVHGIHISPNRPPIGALTANGTRRAGWNIERNAGRYAEFARQPLFRAVRPQLSQRVNGALAQVEDVIRALEAERSPAQRTAARSRPTGTASHTLQHGLVPLLRGLRVTTLLDGGCGAFSWMRAIHKALPDMRYLGVDIDNEVIARNRALFDGQNRRFIVQDLVAAPPPPGRLIVLRDVFDEMSEDDALQLLRNCRDAGVPLVLATTFYLRADNDSSSSTASGANLQRPPFDFPPPTALLPDPDGISKGEGSGKSLGLWSLAQLPLDTTAQVEAAPDRFALGFDNRDL